MQHQTLPELGDCRIYCQDTKGSFVQLDEEVLYEYVKQEFSNTPGDKKFMYDCECTFALGKVFFENL